MSRSLPAKLVPALERVEANFNIQNGLDWVSAHWMISVYTSVAYLLLIYVGRRWMKDRAPWSLRQPLFLWNVGLACFSFFGMSVLVQTLAYNIYTHGLLYTTCHSDCLTDNSVALWGWIFAMSKLVEFGDTFFIVLRKSPLHFLHWYHHVTVCIYTWYSLIPEPSVLSPWFGGMNYTVHTFMYSYYALRANGYKVHPLIAKVVTVMQLSQMFVGIAVNLAAWQMNSTEGVACDFRYDLFYLAGAMYTSYAILFANFFYQRYIKKAPPQRQTTPTSLTIGKARRL